MKNTLTTNDKEQLKMKSYIIEIAENKIKMMQQKLAEVKIKMVKSRRKCKQI